VIALEGVAKRYGSNVAVHPLDLRVEQGRTTVLIGSSGSGKSTVMRMMIGLEVPDEGTVRFAGERLGRGAELREVRRKMGYVIQDGGLFPHLTALGNVALLARFLGWDEERVRARVEELAELTAFPRDGLDRPPARLSGGQQQRVSLMRALMLDPEVLLMDEPLGALDPLIRSDLQDDLKHIFDALGKTVVLVTHDLGEAAFFSDDLVLMHEGRVLQRGSLREMLDRPAAAFVERFVQAQRGVAGVAS